jgi:hypothetical protein
VQADTSRDGRLHSSVGYRASTQSAELRFLFQPEAKDSGEAAQIAHHHIRVSAQEISCKHDAQQRPRYCLSD